MRMQDKVAIVTGAASGIGRACAMQLAAEGATVILTDVDEEAGGKAASECGARAEFIRHDVSSEADWERIIGDVEARHAHLDAIVNNAGILLTAAIEETSVEDFDRVFAINARGPFLGCKHGIPALARSGGGSIVNISSITSMHGSPMHAVYGASKGAVRSLSVAVAALCRERKNGVRCNSVHPGGVNTPLLRSAGGIPEDVDPADFGEQARAAGAQMCEPKDIAQMVLYLASDESRAVNGAALVVDEAYTI